MTRLPDAELTDALEEIIDASNLADTLAMLAEICYGKADHLAANWQDHTAARAWTAAGQAIAKLADRSVITIVS